jgi:hypothetical protein
MNCREFLISALWRERFRRDCREDAFQEKDFKR